MTQVLDRTALTLPPRPPPDSTDPGPAPVRGSRLTRGTSWLWARRVSAAWCLPMLALTAVVLRVNLGGSPQRVDDEGTYVAQAYAITQLGEITHYTYWYDHPPLGWIQIAGWAALTDGFARFGNAVLAGREFMVVLAVVSALLLWFLGRRLGLSRPAAAAALAIFALSPLAVQYHRTVFLDNVATPWLLAAFVLALTPRRQLAAFAAAAACFAVAVLSKETYALFLPFLAWQMWRSAHHGLRRYTVSLAAATVVLLGLSYVLLAVIKGELVPGADRVSLLSGITFQLGGREASGSLFDAASQARVTTGQWLQLDPVLAVVGPVAALAAFRSRRLWPVASAVVFLLAFMLRPGYLPIPYVIGLLPFMALLVPAAVEVALRRARAAGGAGRRSVQTVAVGLVAAVAVSVAAPLWAVQLRGLLRSDLDQPMRQAVAWVGDNVPRDYRVVVDDSMWVDLVRAGFPREDVIWYYKVDTDPAVSALAPNGWRDYDYVVSTNSMRTFPDGSPTVTEALGNAVVVASFGQADETVTIHRIRPEGREAAAAAAEADRLARVAAGTQLASNPAFAPGPGVRDLMTGGRMDSRILVALPPAAAETGRLTLADAPLVPGENDVDQPRRQLLLTAVDGRPLVGDDADRVRATFASQPTPYAPRTVTPTTDGLLLTWSADAPNGLLAGPAG